MVRILWIYPDRGGRQLTDLEDSFWSDYHRAAQAIGVELVVVPPEVIDVVLAGDGSAIARAGGLELSSASTVVLSDAYVYPFQAPDTWLLFSTLKTLEVSGFYLPTTTSLALLTNDKAATLAYLYDDEVAKLGIRRTPTVRLTYRRNPSGRSTAELLARAGIEFPVFVKPTSWAAGQGANIASNMRQLESLLSLSGGGVTPLVVQRHLGSDHSDTRVFVIDGRAAATLVRRPAAGSHVSNVTAGNLGVFEPPRSPLVIEAAEHIARRLDVPFIAVDFIDDGTDLWLSEVELDGAAPPGAPEATHIAEQRFRAYLRRLEAWNANSPGSTRSFVRHPSTS